MDMSIIRRRGLSPKPKDKEMPPRIPAPSYRHASPSGPWPWMNIDSEPELDPIQLATPLPPNAPSKCSHRRDDCDRCWSQYPQSLFPNWTSAQVKRSGLKEKVNGSHTCVIHHVDVDNEGQFSDTERHTASPERIDELWDLMQKQRPQNNRVRALFVENLSVPVMQMLGTKYNIEPFFFSSSVNWIPSRYEEEVLPAQGDHITITLTFLRAMKVPVMSPSALVNRNPNTSKMAPMILDQVIDTQLPLLLRSDDLLRKEDKILLLDLLAIHMIRTPESSTIISYHPSHDRRNPAQPHTSAKRLHSRIGLAGQSVYWQNIFRRSEDPSFVLLTVLWYALYAWDEAFETLWDYIGQLELSVISTNDMLFTQELHKIRAHLLHYSSLLDDFRKSVLFVLDTPNPAMDSTWYDEKEREASRELLKKECNNLLMEIERLSTSRDMQDKRLENVMNLVFSSVTIDDSRRMQALTEAAVRDSAAMKQISYLTMIFLPASFCAGVFGMNIKEINPDSFGSLAQYLETAIPLTTATIWIIVAFQGKWHGHQDQTHVSLWTRLWWPFISLVRLIRGREGGRRQAAAQRWDTRWEAVGKRETPVAPTVVRNGEAI